MRVQPPVHDCKGRLIEEWDILRVLHFRMRHKIIYFYKQVVRNKDGYLMCNHLDGKPGEFCLDVLLNNPSCEVVQSRNWEKVNEWRRKPVKKPVMCSLDGIKILGYDGFYSEVLLAGNKLVDQRGVHPFPPQHRAGWLLGMQVRNLRIPGASEIPNIPT